MQVDYFINFEFEEVNSAVLRNAELYIRKKSNIDTIGVIVPYQFKAIYSQADVLAVIDRQICRQFGIAEYRKLLEYVEAPNSEDLAGRIRGKLRGLRNLLGEQAVQWSKLLGEEAALFMYNRQYLMKRQKKFFVDNKLERYCLDSLARHYGRFKYVRLGTYVNAIDFSVDKFDLGPYFYRNFMHLYNMIADGKFYYSQVAQTGLAGFLPENLSPAQRSGFENFISGAGPKILFRTRNFKNKATVWNSKYELFNALARALVALGAKVLNLGCPLLSLDVRDSRYCEIEHNFPFEVELKLCQVADTNVMTAGAGLFSGFAAGLINIVQIDEEGSATFDTKPVYLFDARRAAGLKDIDIRDLLKKQDFDAAARGIMTGLDLSLQALKAARQKYGPDLPGPKAEIIL